MRWPFFNFQTSVDALPVQTGTGMHFVFIWGEEGCGGGVWGGGGGVATPSQICKPLDLKAIGGEDGQKQHRAEQQKQS